MLLLRMRSSCQNISSGALHDVWRIQVFPLAKTIQLKPEEVLVRDYADRLILEKLTELHAAVKLSELADKLQGTGIGLAAIRSLLASNPSRFAYSDRRWIPAARIEGRGRPFGESIRLVIDRFGGPMPMQVLVQELAWIRNAESELLEPLLADYIGKDDTFVMTEVGDVALAEWVFVAADETVERALALNKLSQEDLDAALAKLKDFDWRQPDAIAKALEKAAPISVKGLGAAAWSVLNPQDYKATLLYNWKDFNATLLAVPGFTFAPDGIMHPESAAKTWISAAVKLAEKIAPTVEIEDAQPIEVKMDDVAKMAKKIIASAETLTAVQLLEEFYEITPSVKTFPDDLANVIAALQSRDDVWWVGGDRFRKPGTAPDFVETIPDVFQFVQTSFLDEEGELVDVELTDDGLSSTLRKLLLHPLATDVLDEDPTPPAKNMPEALRLVLKPIHRELGTFPLSQFPNGFLDGQPEIQELIFSDPHGRELQVWANLRHRLLFNFIDWFYEQPVESGAVFSLMKTHKPNVFEFAWLDQTDPVVYISTQRMEELRDIATRADDMSTLQILQEVMTHWPKGADFLTILWEVNVVRRSTRRLVASLLSSYHCFYQRSGSPVWHYDAKKAEQGFDKAKRKFVKKA
ncbi:MAG: hypothetical protein HONBIEJF_01442 [Fimbriimonadaceae bacterium]|nr:hypothetical protein [Fimbriimonadaceae bacterium]